MVSVNDLSKESNEIYQSSRKAMYLILARMHDMGMNPNVEKAQANEFLSVSVFMLGQAFIANDPELKKKNPLENIAAIEEAYRKVLLRVPLDQQVVDYMTNESELAFLLFLCGGAKVWFENNGNNE